MISQTRYKTIYAIYCLVTSLLILGLHYINHTRLLSGPRGFLGFDWAHRRNLVEVGIISAIAIIVCLVIMIAKRLPFSLWKFLYGIISAAIIFFMEFLMVSLFDQISTSAYALLKLLAIVCFLVSCVVLAGLIIYGCMLKSHSDVNILFDEDCEVVSAILISNIAVTIVTILAYTLLCWWHLHWYCRFYNYIENQTGLSYNDVRIHYHSSQLSQFKAFGKWNPDAFFVVLKTVKIKRQTNVR